MMKNELYLLDVDQRDVIDNILNLLEIISLADRDSLNKDLLPLAILNFVIPELKRLRDSKETENEDLDDEF